MSITNMYIQNPPKNIREQIYRTFDKSIIHETQQPYLEVSKEMIQTFNRQYSERVIGQEKSKKKLLQAIYPLVDGKQSKPVVILLYGDSGLGKTESAQYMAELMGGKLLRKQFSMYQNNESANYILVEDITKKVLRKIFWLEKLMYCCLMSLIKHYLYSIVHFINYLMKEFMKIIIIKL